MLLFLIRESLELINLVINRVFFHRLGDKLDKLLDFSGFLLHIVSLGLHALLEIIAKSKENADFRWFILLLFRLILLVLVLVLFLLILLLRLFFLLILRFLLNNFLLHQTSLLPLRNYLLFLFLLGLRFNLLLLVQLRANLLSCPDCCLSCLSLDSLTILFRIRACHILCIVVLILRCRQLLFLITISNEITDIPTAI